jgi:hypothetical protein
LVLEQAEISVPILIAGYKTSIVVERIKLVNDINKPRFPRWTPVAPDIGSTMNVSERIPP